jgi:hypothetical protein
MYREGSKGGYTRKVKDLKLMITCYPLMPKCFSRYPLASQYCYLCKLQSVTAPGLVAILAICPRYELLKQGLDATLAPSSFQIPISTSGLIKPGMSSHVASQLPRVCQDAKVV